jgi:S-phase kinase-associated protein 1
LDFYLRFDECTRKNRKKVKMDVLSKKLNLISSDGAVFEVDYGVALMSSRFLDIIETIPVGDVGNIFVDEVSSNILNMVIEYCKKQNQNKDLDAEFVVNVDLKTLIDLTIAACYLKVDSLMKLSWSKVDNLINGKTPEEISQIFGAADRRLKLRAIRREQQVESFHFSCFDCDLDTISVDSKMLGH